MNILAIECSQPKASLCLFSRGAIVLQEEWEVTRNHDSFLFPALERALEGLNGEALDLILIGSGPGSYGGVRVAIAAASGIAMVRDCPSVAIPSWTQLAKADPCRPQLIISDAKRGGWTLRQLDGSIEVKSLEEMLQLQGEGLGFATPEAAATLEAHGLKAQAYELVPTAAGLIETWLSASPEEQEQLKSHPLSPIYVRPPHITKAKRKPWEC